MSKKPSSFSKAVGERIRAARIAAALAQRELAEKLGVSQQTILLYERGDIQIPTKRTQELAKTLGISIDDLFDNTTAPGLKRQKQKLAARNRPLSNMELRLLEEFGAIKELNRKRLAIQVLHAFATEQRIPK